MGGLVTALLGVTFLVFALGRSLRDLSYDLSFLVRPEVTPEEVVIVSMDEESHQQLQQPSVRAWDRRLHARLIQELHHLGANLIVYDVLFSNTSDPEADRQLIEAARTHGNVLFAAIATREKSPTGEELKGSKVWPPFEALRAVSRFGLTEASGPERVIREHSRGAQGRPTLAWLAAQSTLAVPLRDALERRWINFYGPPPNLKNLSFVRVLSNQVPSSVLVSNKVVYVGAESPVGPTGGSSTDYYSTPYSPWTRTKATGVEVNATVYLNLIRGDWLRRLSSFNEVVLVLLVGAFLGYGLSQFRPWAACCLALLAAVGFAVLGAALPWETLVWFPWLIPCAIQVPTALAWSILVRQAKSTRATRERRRLLTKLGTPGEFTVEAPSVPNYMLIRKIGFGAYGEVWLAKDIIGMFHAVKIVHWQEGSQKDPREREFVGLQKFTPISRSHPGLVHILHVGRNDEACYFYYIMEAADDCVSNENIAPESYSPRTLAAELSRQKRIPVPECLGLGLALTDALSFLHQQSLVHRDIKPSNIIFVKGMAKLADIGLVTTIKKEAKELTYIGTEGYIPPEGPGAPPADIYSLGKVLYQVLSGLDRERFPDLPTTLLEGSASQALIDLNRIILKACEEDVTRRYKTAAEMRADLSQIKL